MDEIAVLIPCYNESKTIEKVVKDFKRALPEAVIYVRYEYQQGKGNVIRRMFREIDARCYVMTDGDDTYPADEAPKLCEAVLERNADMVVGDRLSSSYFEENKRPFHNFGNTLVRGERYPRYHDGIQSVQLSVCEVVSGALQRV